MAAFFRGGPHDGAQLHDADFARARGSVPALAAGDASRFVMLPADPEELRQMIRGERAPDQATDLVAYERRGNVYVEATVAYEQAIIMGPLARWIGGAT